MFRSRHRGSAILHAAIVTLFWPAAAAVSLAVAVGGPEVTALGLLLLGCGTMSGYGLDRLIDRRGLDPPGLRRGLGIAVVGTSVVALVLACTALWRFKVCVILGVLAGCYVPLKRVLPKNALTVPAWTIAVSALPFADAPDFSGRYAAAATAVALIMLANTVLCDLPDVEEDRRAGVRGIAARFGVRAGAVYAGVAALLGTASAAIHDHPGLAVTAASLVPLAVVLGRNPTTRWARQAVDLVVTVLPGPITLLTQIGSIAG